MMVKLGIKNRYPVIIFLPRNCLFTPSAPFQPPKLKKKIIAERGAQKISEISPRTGTGITA
jgi:hypothetical protein